MKVLIVQTLASIDPLNAILANELMNVIIKPLKNLSTLIKEQPINFLSTFVFIANSP